MTLPTARSANKRKLPFLLVLIAIVLLLNLFVFGWMFLSSQNVKKHGQEEAATVSQNLAHVLEQRIGGMLDKVELNLFAASDEISRQMTNGGIDSPRLNAYLINLHSRFPEVNNLRIVNSDGVVTHGTDAARDSTFIVSDEYYFRYLRDTPDAGTVVSQPIFGRISHKWLILLSRRLNNPDGTFAGVVFGTVHLERFIELFSALDIGEKGTINLRGANMGIVARYPMPPDIKSDIEQNKISSQLQDLQRSKKYMGTYMATVPYDDVERTISYRRISNWPLYVFVGLAADDYLEAYRRDVFNNIIMATFFALVSMLFAAVLYRDWTARKRAMEDLDQQQKKFRSLAAMSSDWFWEQDSNCRFAYISGGSANGHGLNFNTLIGKTCWEVDPDKAGVALAAYKSHAEAHQPFEDFEYSFQAESGKKRWLGISGEPVFDANGTFQGYRGVAKDITERKDAQERERHLKNVYQALSATNEAIIHVESESALFPLICRIAVGYGEMLLAWVGVPDTSNRLMQVASDGKENVVGYLDDLTILVTPDAPEGRGPSGIAYREKKPVVFHDMDKDEMAVPWREKAREYGIKAGAAFPIIRDGKSYAIWAVYSDRVGAFDEETVQLLEEMAANISFALKNFDSEAWRHQAELALRESEEWFRTLFEGSVDAIFIMDMTGRYVDVNERGARMLGYSREEVLELKISDIVAEEERNRIPADMAEWKKVYASDYVLTEWRFVRKDGSVFIGEVNAKLLPDGRFMGVVRDVTERKKADEELKLAALVYQDSSEGMMITDADNWIIAVNPVFEHITGFKAEDAIGKHANLLFSAMQDNDSYKAIDKTLKTNGNWKGELWSHRKNGEEFAVMLSISTSFNPDGSVYRRVALFSDITKRKESDDLIWQQANFDALTGLPNRNLFRDHLRHEIRKAKRANLPVALMFLDLDGFKDVNDTLGHDMGDILLKSAAERLNNCVREIDTVARLGGDEFTVILSELHDAGNVDRVARHILQQLSEPFQLTGEVAHVSASIGITFYPEDATEIEDLLKNADQAMYAAKQAGRNQYQYFTASMQEAAQARMRLINDLRVALENNQFDLVYQPIVELATGAIRKAEALIRWQHPSRGLINPAEFIPAAEDTGMITSFGDWVFHEAASQAARWRATYHTDFQISVNISPVQFRKEGIDSTVWFDHLKSLGLSARGIVVEITEGLLLDASANVTGQLLALRDAGIEVALDDFGTGYSSLSYLKKFDIDYLKIDQSFVRNLSSGSSDMALCEAIIVMAHKLGIKVIAEGVETKQQRDFLAAAECDYVQGYLFSGPISATELEKLLKADPFTSQTTTML